MHRSPKLRSTGLFSVALTGAVCACGERGEPVAVVQQRVLDALQAADEVGVLVGLRDPEPESLFRDPEGHRWALRNVRESFVAASGSGFSPTRAFDHVPAVAGRLSGAGLESLLHNPNVSFVQLDGAGRGALAVSVPAIGADVASSSYGVTGRGVRVAVLDTGINTNHPDLQSSVFPTQHCFTTGACPPGNASEGTSAEDDHGHGSHVSGIVTSDGSIAGAGFAPDAEIVAVKINDFNDSGWVSDWVAGLDWVFTNLSTLGVKVINMSICTDQMYGSQTECDAGEPALAAAVQNLVDAGVVVFAASGNVGSADHLSAPACNSGVIAVGATYKSNQGRQPQSGTYSAQWGNSFADCADATTAFDQIACFTNSGERLDIVAPGAVITSDTLGTTTEEYRGTSQASPTAAGVAALMLECNPTLDPSEVKDILAGTGVAVVDPKNGTSYPSIRAAAAVEQACSASAGSGSGGAGDTGGSSAGGAGAASGTIGDGGTGLAGPTTGGDSATGGAGTSTGGAATGGTTVSSGGSGATGGTTVSSGGSGATGGTTVSSGGAAATGGAGLSSGGAAATGGTTVSSGGNSPTGGAGPSTGGATATGGTAAAVTTGGIANGGSSTVPRGGSAAGPGAQHATGGLAQADPATGGSATPSVSTDSGCSCRAAAASPSRSAGLAAWGMLLGLLWSRRRGKRAAG